MANRHLSRSIVLQTLFEWDFLPSDKKNINNPRAEIKEILARNMKEFAPGLEDDHFVSALIEKVLTNKVAIDEIISKAAPDWPL